MLIDEIALMILKKLLIFYHFPQVFFSFSLINSFFIYRTPIFVFRLYGTLLFVLLERRVGEESGRSIVLAGNFV